MPGVKGQPCSAKRKNQHRRKSASKYKGLKERYSLPPSKKSGTKPQPPRACTCTCKEHTSTTRREKRLEKRVAVLTQECKAHKHSAQFEKAAHKDTVVECHKHHVEVRTVSDKPFAEQDQATKAKTLLVAVNAMEAVRNKLGLSTQEYAVATLYWGKVYAGVTEEKQQQPPSPGSAIPGLTRKGKSNIWNQEWEKMHLLRAIADEIVVSSAALRRIFLVLGMAGLTGGQMDRMKQAMDLAVASRIRFYDIEGPGGENVGVYLNVADVMRQMIMSANGRPGEDYNIVLTGDGR